MRKIVLTYGFISGGILAATAMYIGAKTGIAIGVNLTSVILAFATFRLLAGAGLAPGLVVDGLGQTLEIACLVEGVAKVEGAGGGAGVGEAGAHDPGGGRAAGAVEAGLQLVGVGDHAALGGVQLGVLEGVVALGQGQGAEVLGGGLGEGGLRKVLGNRGDTRNLSVDDGGARQAAGEIGPADRQSDQGSEHSGASQGARVCAAAQGTYQQGFRVLFGEGVQAPRRSRRPSRPG